MNHKGDKRQTWITESVLILWCSMGGDSLLKGKAVKLTARKVLNLSTLKLSNGPGRSLY